MAAADPILVRYLDYARQSGLTEATTIYNRELSLLRLQAALEVPLIEATKPMLAQWRAGLAVSDQVVRNYVSDARQFYLWAMASELRADNPAAGLPVPRKGRRLPRPIADADLFHAIACAPTVRMRLWLLLGSYGGLRAKEVALLRRENVLDTGRPPALLIAGDATKGSFEHMVPMAPYLLGELRPYLPSSGWVFRRADGKPGPNRPHLISHLVNDFLRSCGITATFHQCRHWFGTNAYGISKDLLQLKQMMGHRDPASTALYAEVYLADAAEIVAALPVPGRLRAVG